MRGGWRRLMAVGLAAAVLFLGRVEAARGEDGGRSQRFGVWGAYAESAEGKPDSYGFWSINPYWGVFLNDPGRGYKGSFEFCVEGFYAEHVSDFSDRWEFGVMPILRWHYGFGERVSPFLEVSAGGMEYTNLEVHETGSDFNFTNHIGAGVNVRLDPKTVLSLAYRFRHISNGGLAERNSGLEHHQGLLGISFSF